MPHKADIRLFVYTYIRRYDSEAANLAGVDVPTSVALIDRQSSVGDSCTTALLMHAGSVNRRESEAYICLYVCNVV